MLTLDLVAPGELLKEEFLLPMEITQYRLAKEISVPAQRIGEIVAGSYDTEIAFAALAEELKNIRPWSGSPKSRQQA